MIQGYVYSKDKQIRIIASMLTPTHVFYQTFKDGFTRVKKAKVKPHKRFGYTFVALISEGKHRVSLVQRQCTLQDFNLSGVWPTNLYVLPELNKDYRPWEKYT